METVCDLTQDISAFVPFVFLVCYDVKQCGVKKTNFIQTTKCKRGLYTHKKENM